jgi:galactokinase
MLTVRAPGRINLIGEHTDYNDGFVLPAAISREIRISLVPTADRRVEIELKETGEQTTIDLDAIGQPIGGWIDYVAGVADVLIRDDRNVGGFRGVLSSDLPTSAGLSSSAALELVAAWALLSAGAAAGAGGAEGVAVGGANGPGIDRLELAQLCQRAENGYVGVNSGLMDQFAASCGVAGHALLLDCRSLEYRAVPVPADIALVVVDTGSRRRLVGSAYNERRAQCERGVAILAGRGEPVRALRDATVEMLGRAAAELGDITYRRCRHVVEENERTLAAADALQTGDRRTLGALFAASHASLRDLYGVSSRELDVAVEIASATPGVIAARLTGAGFGGCTINLVENDAVERLADAIESEYPARTALTPRIYRVDAAEGAGVLAGSMAS